MGVVTSCLDFFHVGMPTLEKILMIAPPYAFSNAIIKTGKQNMNRILCKEACEKSETCMYQPAGWMCEKAPEMCCDSFDHRFSFESPGFGLNVTLLVLVSVLATSLLLIIDFEVFKQCVSKIRELKSDEMLKKGEQDEVDEDVLQEKFRVRNMGINEIEDHQLVTKDLSKCYGKLVAVNQLCLSIEK